MIPERVDNIFIYVEHINWEFEVKKKKKKKKKNLKKQNNN